MRSVVPAESTTRADHTFTSGKRTETKVYNAWLVPASPLLSQPTHRGRAEANQKYAPPQSYSWYGGVMAPTGQCGYTRSPESLFRVIHNWDFSHSHRKNQPIKQNLTNRWPIPASGFRWMWRWFHDAASQTHNYFCFNIPIDEFMRLCFLAAYLEQLTYSSADFLKKLSPWYARKGIRVECVQTNNGFALTNRFSNRKRDISTLFELTVNQLDIRHKLIRLYKPRHNGKVERSHRDDQKRFYFCHCFYSLYDF